MHWKKSLMFFTWQSIKYAESFEHFKLIWSYYRSWKKSFLVGRNSMSDELPWLNFPALEYLKKNLRPEFKVFEFGGGGSTLFFCKNATETTTVEHDGYWFETLKKTIEGKGYRNWNGILVLPEILKDNHSRRPDQPDDYISSSAQYKNQSFEKYARTICQFQEGYFDLVLVDGRARPSCIKMALPHVKPGGLLVIDNTDRSHYLSLVLDDINKSYENEFDLIAPVRYTPDFTRTTVFIKK
ncbi:MAG: hypothetical protein KDD14_11370 [Saprospiraceae bacterium]|nr:hypothetical protein [Saprospiraceae bacterium]